MTADILAAIASCADEPIRVPGMIQPHGRLLAVSEPDLVVRLASGDADDVGRPLAQVLPDLATVLQHQLGPDIERENPRSLVLGGAPYDAIVHRTDGLIVVELEQSDGDLQGPWYSQVPATLEELRCSESLEELTAVLATEVRRLTGFDRVMVYRFDDEWNGEVVAEDRREDLDPFLGLRYPSTDIPPQARELYRTNWLRLIPDATYEPVPLLPAEQAGIDLGQSVLRSVSPVHLEYLRNMGVVASMSVSLLDRDRLWGLIACHHYRGPHRPSYRVRLAAEFLGRTASVLLTDKQEAGSHERELAVAAARTDLTTALSRAPREALQALTASDCSLLELLPCGSAALRLEGRLHLLGDAPDADEVRRIAQAIWPSPDDRAVVARSDFGGARTSGVLAVPVNAGVPGDYLMWFRPEVLRKVTWAGDPHTSKVVGDRLTPRASFAAWTETVRGTAQPWERYEISAATDLGRDVSDTLLRRVANDSRLAAALQRTVLLEELPEVPGLALAARYLPSAEEVVGGDWYDLVLLPGDRVALVLGDVAGHGLGAAATTAQLRHALRAYLLRERTAAEAMQRLNELVTHLLPQDLATVVMVEVDRAAGTVRITNAGHPPLLHLSGTGARYIDEGRGPALGLAPVAYTSTTLALEEGDVLLMFSDGLVERRGQDLDDGLADLRRRAEAARREPEAVCEHVAPAAGALPDDVTLLALSLRAER